MEKGAAEYPPLVVSPNSTHRRLRLANRRANRGAALRGWRRRPSCLAAAARPRACFASVNTAAVCHPRRGSWENQGLLTSRTASDSERKEVSDARLAFHRSSKKLDKCSGDGVAVSGGVTGVVHSTRGRPAHSGTPRITSITLIPTVTAFQLKVLHINTCSDFLSNKQRWAMKTG